MTCTPSINIRHKLVILALGIVVACGAHDFLALDEITTTGLEQIAGDTEYPGDTAPDIDPGTNNTSSRPENRCFVGRGYWMTHSDLGPAPYDQTWEAVGNADAPFFATGLSWYQIFWTPTGGNAYFQLAPVYGTVILNSHRGADLSNISDSLQIAEQLLDIDPATLAAGIAPNSELGQSYLRTARDLLRYHQGQQCQGKKPNGNPNDTFDNQ